MIFVTVGFAKPFDRLIRKMDEIAAGTSEPVVMQIGNATYVPTHAEYFRDAPSLDEYFSRARVIVTHGGTTMLELVEKGVPFVVVPRLKRFAEHIDDHQLELSRLVAERAGVEVVLDIEELPRAISRAKPPAKIPSSRNGLIQALRQFLDEISRG